MCQAQGYSPLMVPAIFELRQREGALGQRLKHEIARTIACRERLYYGTGSIRPVTGEARACAYEGFSNHRPIHRAEASPRPFIV